MLQIWNFFFLYHTYHILLVDSLSKYRSIFTQFKKCIYSSTQFAKNSKTNNWNYQYYNSYFLPSFLMLLFGLLTLNNLRQRRQIVPRASQGNQVVRRTDTQLLRMLTAQVLVIIICTLPFSIYRLYSTFTANLVKDTLRIAQENLAFQIVGAMTYFAHSSSFYLYTLTGTIFRKELIKITRRYWHPNRNSTLRAADEMYPMSVLQRNEQHNNNVTRKSTI